MGEEDTRLVPQQTSPTTLDKGGPASLGELPGESPIVQTMTEIGEIVAQTGRFYNDIEKVTKATGETPLIKLLRSPWDAQGNQVYGQVDLGVVKDGKFEEGFRETWTFNITGLGEFKREFKSSASITAELRQRPTPEEQQRRQLFHPEMYVTLYKSGSIVVSVDSQTHPDITKIPDMKEINPKEYRFTGKVSRLPEGLEQFVMPMLTRIRDGLNPKPASAAPTM